MVEACKMALVDNPTHLLQFIRRCFITGDNTAFCERTIVDENVSTHDVLDMLDDSYCTKKQQDLAKHSPDIYLPPWRLGHIGNSEHVNSSSSFSTERPRASNGVVLRKLKANARFAKLHAGVNERDEPAVQAQTIKTTLSMDKPSSLDERSIAELFTFSKPSELEDKQYGKRRSVCTSFLVEAKRRNAANPFMEFAKFNAHGRPVTRTYEIFYTFTSRARVPTSQKVQVSSDTLVREAIGLSLLFYVQQKREPNLQLSAELQDSSKIVDSFELYIADDDGSAELDFPRLEPADQIGKYDFVRLALVWRATDRKKSRAKLMDAAEEEFELKKDSEQDSTSELNLVAERTVRRFDSRVDEHAETHQPIGHLGEADHNKSVKRSTRQLSAPLISPIGVEPSTRQTVVPNDVSGVSSRAPQSRLSLSLSWITTGEPNQTRESRTYSSVGQDAIGFGDSGAGAFEFECKLLRRKLFTMGAVLRITASTVQIEPIRPGTKRSNGLWFKNLGSIVHHHTYIYPIRHIVACKRLAKTDLKATLTMTCVVNSAKFALARASQPDFTILPSENSLSSATMRASLCNSGESFTQSRPTVASILLNRTRQKIHTLEMAAESAERACSLINNLLERLESW